MLVSTLVPTVYAQLNEDFGTRMIPSKLVEKSDGVLQVYVKSGQDIIPKKISDLTATSLDSSIIRVTEVKQSSDGFISEIYLKTIKPGQTKIFLAAAGFSTKEIPVTVYGSKLNQEQLLVKTVPSTFSLNGPSRGYVSIQLADMDGFPVYAKEDTVVNLSSSDNNIVRLIQPDLIIKKGQYFGLAEFEIKKKGEANIYASSLGIKTAKSSTITINEENDLTVALYVLPEKLNTFSTSRSYIIAQLQDAGGKPVIAKDTIVVDFQITNSNYSQAINSSPTFNQYGQIKQSGFFEIKKGTYWGYTQFSTLTGIEDTYNVLISTKDPLAVKTAEVETKSIDLFDDKLIKFKELPVLATGNKELIGVVYLEDEDENQVLAEKDILVKIESSDEEFVTVDNPVIKRGFGSQLVFANIANSAPSKLDIHVVGDESDQLESIDISGPKKESNQLVVEPLVSKILGETEFPIAIYLKDGEEITKFSNDADLFISPSEYYSIQPSKVLTGNDLVLVNAKSLKKGTDTISFVVDDYTKDVSLESISEKPSKIQLDNSETIFTGNNDIASIQLLDSQNLPVFASDDIEIKIIPKNSDLISVPDKVVIEKGNYYTSFDIAPKSSGETELTAIVEEIPPVSSKIKIVNLSPVIQISAPEIIEKDSAFDASLSATYNNLPLTESGVTWKVDGAIVQISDSKTNKDGKASISMIGVSEKSVSIEATVNSAMFPSTKVSKIIKVNSTNSEFVAFGDSGQNEKFQQIEIFGFDPVIILVPAVLGAAGFILRKKGLLKIKN